MFCDVELRFSVLFSCMVVFMIADLDKVLLIMEDGKVGMWLLMFVRVIRIDKILNLEYIGEWVVILNLNR